MPDREPSARRRRRGGSSSQNLSRKAEWPYEPYEADGRRRQAGTHQLGIPRILGRRARWVGARLRREG